MRAAILVICCLAWGIGPAEARTNKEAAAQFRVVPVSTKAAKAKVPLYVTFRNQGREVLRLIPSGAPIVWGFVYDPVTKSRRRAQQVRAPDESIEDIQSVVFVRTAEMEEGRDVCRSAEGRVAVAAGKEVVLEISVDFGLVDDGIYDVVFNLAVLVAPGRDTCAQARYERGQARLRVEVQGDHVRM